MKLNKIVLVSLILLAVFMLGTVSAADDISTDVAVSQDIDDSLSESPIEEDENTDGEILTSADDFVLSEKKDSKMNISFVAKNDDDEIYTIDKDNDIIVDNYEHDYLGVTFPEKVSGKLSVYIDGKSIANRTISKTEHYFYVNKESYNLELGTHTWAVNYSGDDNYAPASQNGTFTISYRFEAYPWEDPIAYGDEAKFDLYFPYTESGIINYTVNGKKYSKKVVEEGETTITISDLAMGKNAIVFTFAGENYAPKYTIGYVTAEGRIIAPNSIEYGDAATMTLTLPKDAKGNLHIFEYGDWNETTDSYDKITIKKVPVKDGKAEYVFSNLTFGYNYPKAEYDGNDYNVTEFDNSITVNPKAQYSTKIWVNSTNNNIVIDYPSDITGNIEVSIGCYDDEWEYHTVNVTTVKSNGKVSIPLPKLDAGDYEVSIEFTSDATDWYKTYDLYVLKETRDTTIQAEIESEITYGMTDIFKNITIPYMADGDLVILADGKEIVKTTISSYDLDNLSKLSVGNHNIEVKFDNDTYYKSTSITGKVAVTYFTVYGSTFSTSIDEDATGYVSLTIDGKSYDTQYLNNGYAYMEVDSNVSYGKHSYELKYSGDAKYPSETKKGTFEHEYPMDLFCVYSVEDTEWASYYGETEFVVEIPIDGTGNVTISVDGKEIGTITNFTRSIGGKFYGLFGSLEAFDMPAGNHTVSASYSDAKYPLKVLEHKFTVLNESRINAPYYSITYKQETNSEITLTLPADAKGNLVVDIDGDKKTVKLENGHAKYSLASLAPGYYEISAYYDGTDYNVKKVFLYDEDASTFKVYPKIDIKNDGTYYLGENNTISIEVQKEAKGKFTVEITNDLTDEFVKTATVQLVNGKGTLSISDLPIGLYYMAFEYDGDDVSIPYDNEYVEVSGNVTVDYPDEIYKNEKATLTFKSPKDTKGELTVKIGTKSSKYQLVNGTVTVPLDSFVENLKVDEYHYIYLTYTGDKIGNYEKEYEFRLSKAKSNITVTPQSSSSFTVEVEKGATGKVVLSVNGKDYEQSLSNGKATISVGNIASGDNTIAVAYSGDGNYQASSEKTTFSDKSKIVASDMSMQYNDGSKYSVTVYDKDGKLASGVSVTFKIDGKKVGTGKTNSKGVATLKITQTPKTYKISAIALGKTVTKKLTVKQILTLKKVTVKKSAKKLVLTATLKKVKGKYLKNKKITFKFNGKKYTAKTNKKGVAKVTIKSSVLKKLKVGKKVTYQATYVKDTVKKTVKVKK